MRQYIKFKGSRNGLQLVLDDVVDFEVILENLKLIVNHAENEVSSAKDSYFNNNK